LPDSARAELRELLAYRGQLVAEIVARKSQLEHYQTAPLVARAERALMALRPERAALDQEIGRVICSDPALAEPCRLPTSAPGVGPILAATLLAELPELGRLGRRQGRQLGRPRAGAQGQRRAARRAGDPGRPAPRCAGCSTWRC
jgi:transposase